MTITAQMVKELRDSTGAGMMDAKKALTEVNGDMEAAVDWLRTKGLAKAAKKADRVAAEGLVGVAVSNGRGVAVEINSETDFVAKNADFQALVRDVANVALTVGDSVEVVKAAHLNGKTVDTVVQEAISRIGENMTFRRLHVLEGDTVVSYVHNAAADGMGKIGVLVALKGDAAKAQVIGKQFAMHIAATSPLSLSEATLDPVVLERELAVQTAKALEENAASAKPKPDAGDPQQYHPGPDEAFPCGKHASGPGLRDQPRPDRGSRGQGSGRGNHRLCPRRRWRRHREEAGRFRCRSRQGASGLIPYQEMG
jgi:elongation factor Ts